MTPERQFGRDMGRFFGSRFYGVQPLEVNIIDGSTSGVVEDFRKDAHSEIMNVMADIVSAHIGPKAASLPHLRALASKPRYHSEHVKRASDLVFDIIGLSDRVTYDGMIKSGGSWAPEMTSLVLWLMASGAALGGAGAGALYWHGDREMTEDTAQNIAKQRKIDYYKQLAKEVNQGMSEEYEYKDEEEENEYT
jgi:hypothetical protein